MKFVFCENIEKNIAKYNIEILQGRNSGFNEFARRMLVAIQCNGRPDKRESSKEILDVLDKINYDEALQKWLKKQGVDYISLDDIKCVLISTEILGEDLSKYSGFAQKVGNIYYIYVEYDKPVERTISILTHEIVHIEMDYIFRRYEELYRNKIDKELEEEAVIFLEHYILEKVFSINRCDISIEERYCYLNEFCMCVDENCLEESLYRWLKKSQDVRKIAEHSLFLC